MLPGLATVSEDPKAWQAANKQICCRREVLEMVASNVPSKNRRILILEWDNRRLRNEDEW
jgi:hypothetical protein